MTAGDVCNREVIITDPGTTVTEAAKLMRQYHVGDLVLVRGEDGGNRPVGIVTDRDLVVEVLAQERDPSRLAVGDIAATDLLAAGEHDDLFVTLYRMRGAGVRRMPVVDRNGKLLGILTMDDVLDLLADELNQLTHLVGNERKRESRYRP